MQFPFNLFSDLLAEFQKYLANRTARPVYWATGLVVAALSAIVGYLAGWNALLDAWDKTDTFLKLVLSGTTVIAFLLLAYLLGHLQSTVERWFQGEWPRRWQASSLEWHRAAWQKHQDTSNKMGELYGKLHTAVKAITQSDTPLLLQTKHTLPRYSIITEEDLEAVPTDEVPADALHDLQAAAGMMTLHSISPEAVITNADALRLPPGLEHAVIIPLSVSELIVPAGLVPGDLVVVYAQTPAKDRAMSFKPSLILDVQHMSDEEANGTKVSLVRLTLAMAPDDVEAFVMLADTQILRIIRPVSQSTPSLTPQATGNQPATSQTTGNQPATPQISGNQSITPSVAASPATPSQNSADDLLKKLGQEYEAGQQWFKLLRAGTVETKIPPHAATLAEAFAFTGPPPTTTGNDPQEQWLLQINEHRNKWIRLLQDAYKETEYRIDQHQKTFPLYYPATIEKVAPTAIGNVFHAVDSYCDRLYGLDIALVLPRLQTVMEENTRDQLKKAHDQLELFEWLYLGSIAVGIIGTLMAFNAQHYLLAFLLWFLVLPVPRFILYPAALKAALDYASTLRLAVDHERSRIISKAGFSLPSPTNQEQEKALWKQIQRWWAYGNSPGDYILTIERLSSDTNSEKTT